MSFNGVTPTTLKMYAEYGNLAKIFCGGGIVVGIIVAFGYDDALLDFDLFCKEFDIVNKQPKIIKFPAKNPKASPHTKNKWGIETALCLQYVRAFSPMSEIICYFASSDNMDDMIFAAEIASHTCDIICMSFGKQEFLSQKKYSSFFKTSKSLFICATGNNGKSNFPSVSPYVLSVGGTFVDFFDEKDTFVKEKCWEKSYHGNSLFEKSLYFPEKMRYVPDLSFWAHGNSGAEIYYRKEKCKVSGTSVSTACISGMCACIASKSKRILNEKSDFFLKLKKQAKKNKISKTAFRNPICDNIFCGLGVIRVEKILEVL